MKTAFITVLIIALVALGYIFYTRDNSSTGIVPSRNGDETTVCTMDAKLCPDGSYVGRQGPNCEFVECPTSTSVKTDVKVY